MKARRSNRRRFLGAATGAATAAMTAAPIEAGYQHAVACILADRAWETGRRQVYDPLKREIREG